MDPILGQDLEGGDVGGGLGEPHTLWLATEAMAEVANSPVDLGFAVVIVGQGHYDVVINLGHG